MIFGTDLYSQKLRNSHNENLERYNVGKAYYNDDNFNLAIKEFDQIINDDPYFFNAYFKKSYSYYHLKDYSTALKEINKAYNISNIDHKYFYMKGQYFDKLKQYEIALYYLDLAINFSDDNLYYYNYRGGLHLELGNYKHAINDYDILLSENPKLYNVYFNRGIAKYNIKMIKEACSDWLTAYNENESCKRYFFYKCTKINLDGFNQESKSGLKTQRPIFNLISDQNFSSFIANKLNYPQVSLLNEEQGMVLVKFTLTKQLKIENLEILHSISDSIDIEVMNVIKSSQGYWVQPAKRKNIPIDIDIIVPVSFKIEEGEINNDYLMDTLQQYFKSGNYEEIIHLTTKMLRSNPFLFEVHNIRKTAFEKLNLDDVQYNSNWFEYLKSFNGIYLKEVQSYNKAVKLYFNDKWELTDKKNAKYYRLTQWDNNNNFYDGRFCDYKMDGLKYEEGTYYSRNRSGKFISYYSNGNIKQEINFFSDYRNPKWKSFFENGTIKNIVEVNGFDFKLLEQYDLLGRSLYINGDGEFVFSFLNYLATDTILVTGNYKKYKKEDFWKLYINGELVAFDEYRKDVFKQGLYIEGNNKTNVFKPSIGSWIFVPTNIVRTEEIIEDSMIDLSYYWFLQRDKEMYLNPKGE